MVVKCWSPLSTTTVIIKKGRDILIKFENNPWKSVSLSLILLISVFSGFTGRIKLQTFDIFDSLLTMLIIALILVIFQLFSLASIDIRNNHKEVKTNEESRN